jgi:CNT family concentrative nucleoside transporter
MAAVLPDVSGAPLSIERIFTWIFAPVAYAMGIPWAEAGTAGALLGTKTALNELLAYLALSQLPPDALSPRSELILTYALCGFANFGSLGIMLGGLTAMVPERRADLVRLAPRSLISGTLATCLTGATVGILV